MTYTRYGIYYLPPAGAFADFGASWVGWDVASGQARAQFDTPNLDRVTTAPRKYGFHATLKPPFRLAEGTSGDDLTDAVATLARTTAPAMSDGLELSALGRFLALTPFGDVAGIQRVAAACVTTLDPFRAAASEQELAKRRAAGLSAAQEAMLLAWGYPYVLDAFRFHITLTDRLPKPEIDLWRGAVAAHLPDMPRPFVLDAICLVAERPDGQFEQVGRYTLDG